MTKAPKHSANERYKRQINWLSLIQQIDHTAGGTCASVAAQYEDVTERTLQRHYKQWHTAQRTGDQHAIAVAEGRRHGCMYNQSALGHAGDDALGALLRGAVHDGRLVTRAFIADQATLIHGQQHVYTTRATRTLKMSNRFVTGVTRRQRLTRTKLKVVRRKPRAATDEADHIDGCIRYIERVHNAISTYGSQLVMNADETPAKSVQSPSTCISIKGERNMITSRQSLKNAITVMPTICADGYVLPLQVLIKGKTQRCIDNKHLSSSVHASYTHSGWQTSDTFVRYLNDVIVPYTHGRPSALIIDRYGAHMTKKVRRAARHHNIKLIFVPPGETAELQPLDVTINGIIKAKARSKWVEQKRSFGDGADTVQRAVERVESSLSEISTTTIAKAFTSAVPTY